MCKSIEIVLVGTGKPCVMPAGTSTVQLLATGGTIQNPPDTEGYMSGSDLVENIPELADVADVSVEEISNVASQNVSTEIWYELAKSISEIDKSEVDGVVITSGSNAVEETAYLLNLVVDTTIPVVLTAAQRNHTLIGNDGDKNLLDATRVATHPDSRGRGVLVVVNEEIHHAREVTKVINSRPNGWSSGDVGPLGFLDKYGMLRYYRNTERDHTTATAFDMNTIHPDTFPEVEIVYAYAGAKRTLVDALVEKDIDGIVLAGFASGHPAAPHGMEKQAAAIEDAIDAGFPVVVTHRGRKGWNYFYSDEFATPITQYEKYVDEWNYMVGNDDEYIWGDNLTPQKARILLSVSLTETTVPEELQKNFYLF